jgi:hypothetical protein
MCACHAHTHIHTHTIYALGFDHGWCCGHERCCKQTGYVCMCICHAHTHTHTPFMRCALTMAGAAVMKDSTSKQGMCACVHVCMLHILVYYHGWCCCHEGCCKQTRYLCICTHAYTHTPFMRWALTMAGDAVMKDAASKQGICACVHVHILVCYFRKMCHLP